MCPYPTEKLARQDNEVTLFASGDSETKARLVAACRRSLRLDKHCVDQLAHQILMVERVFHEIGDGEKEEFLGNAYALLVPIDWPEPFGLVM